MEKLPELPKQYKRREAKIDGLVIDWFKRNYPYSCAIEVKIKGGKLKEHQLLALDEVSRGKFSYKIPDMGRKNPFDGFTLIKAKAFVVTCDGMECEADEINGETYIKFNLKCKVFSMWKKEKPHK